MKKLTTIIALLLICIAAGAKDFALRRALLEFVKDKAVEVQRSDMRGVDKNSTTDAGRPWQVSAYCFTMPASDAAKLEPIFKAYETDRNRKDVNVAIYSDIVTQAFEFPFSNRMPAIHIGRIPGSDMHMLVVSGKERAGVNTICGMEWKEIKDGPAVDSNNSNKRMIGGALFILERDYDFYVTRGGVGETLPMTVMKKNDTVVADTVWVDTVVATMDYIEMSADEVDVSSHNNDFKTTFITPSNTDSENIQRMKFYAKKYKAQIMQANGSTIVKAMLFVVDEIVRKGTAAEKSAAKQIIDDMISSTPAESFFGKEIQRTDVRESKTTLLNLLQRLEAGGNTATLRSTPKTFVIDGTIDEGLWDVGYYVYTSDESMLLNDNEPEVISVVGRSFRYEAELEGIRQGRVRALMKDGTVCSAWIDLIFVPGETAELNVHNGTYTLGGTGFYQQYNNAKEYINEAAVKAKDELMNEMEGLKGMSVDEVMKYCEDENNAKANEEIFNKHVLEMLKQHTNEPGVFYYVMFETFRNNTDMCRRCYELLSPKLKQSEYGVFLRKYTK